MIKRYKIQFLLTGSFLLFWLLIPYSVNASIKFVDAAGRDVVLKNLPRRIAVVGQAPFIPLHMVYMFEETLDRLKGFEVRVKKDDEFLKLIDPEYAQRIKLSTNPGPESIAALKPDLVISKGTIETSLAKSLKQLDIPVMFLGVENPEMFLRDIANLGEIFGNQQRAQDIIQYFQDKLHLIHLLTGNIILKQKPKVLLLEYSNRGKSLSVNVPAESWIQTQQVKIAGGNPVWLSHINRTDGWQITGFEQIAAWNPDIIYLVVWYQLKGPKVLKKLYNDPKWSQLKAVKQNHLYLFPQDIFGWDSATPRWILGALWMATKNYPEQFNSEGMILDDMVYEFFTHLYKIKRQTIKNRIMPEIYETCF